MVDIKMFELAYARFQALRKNVPSSIGESEVTEYNSIVEFLEKGSGEALALFRITAEKLTPKIVQARRGSYRGGRGSAVYSSEKYCDRNYLVRQIEALWQYLQTVKDSTSETNESSKDYWSLTDSQLEVLAGKYGIQPLTRTGQNHEQWHVDRKRIIAELLRRDEALGARLPAAQTTNIVNIGRMQGSALQQGTRDSSIAFNYKPNEAELRNVLGQVLESVEKLRLPNTAEQQLRVDIDTINVQLSAANPRSSVISECLASVKSILEHAAGHALAVAVLAKLNALGI